MPELNTASPDAERVRIGAEHRKPDGVLILSENVRTKLESVISAALDDEKLVRLAASKETNGATFLSGFVFAKLFQAEPGVTKSYSAESLANHITSLLERALAERLGLK